MSSLIQLQPALTRTGYRNGFEAYKLWVGVQAHIQTNFDGLKYNWKRRIAAKWDDQNFPDKYQFDRIANKYVRADWPLLFGRNCINTGWVRDVVGDEGENRFLEARGFIENAENKFSALFRSYLFSLHNKRIKFIDSLTGQQPFVMSQVQQKVYPIEFLVLLDSATPFLASMDSIIYGSAAKRIHKYGQMFRIDTDHLRNVIKSACS